MAASAKIVQVGNSLGVLLSKEMLAKMRVSKGDTLFFNDTPAGFEVTPYDPEFAEVMAVAEKVMRRRRDVLRKLAQ